MTRFRPFLSTLFALASLSLCIFVASCGSDHHRSADGAIWFVHATDPHIYKGKINKGDLTKITDPLTKPKLQKADEDALTALFKKIPELPQTYGPPAFLLITGDFGVDPCEIADPVKVPKDNRDPNLCLGSVDNDIRDAQIKNLAALFAKSPVPNIYFVAGNNDVPREAATGKSLKYFNDFFGAVRDELGKSNPVIHLTNLTSCYEDPKNAALSCSIDIPKTNYTLIGFPSQTFKNRDGADADANNASLALEAAQAEQFRDLLDIAVKGDRRILIVTHIPELDDPYLLGVQEFGKEGDLKDLGSRLEGPTPGVSAWNVNDKILTGWKNAVASNSVVAVFAGHLHDSHQEAYRRPYSWSTQTDSRIALNKLYLAPPLSLKKQDTSIFQARGFSTITLFPNSVEQRLYWYDSQSKTFTPDPTGGAHHARWLAHTLAVARWFWDLDSKDGTLERMTVLLIALIAAFLTVVAVWQIPPTDDLLTKKPANKDGGDKGDPKSNGDSSPFTTKLGKTVIGGVGGFVFTDIAKALCSKELSDEAKCFYLVWFIIFFFLLLFLSALFRGFVEAIRSRVAVIYYPLARPPRPRGGSSQTGGQGSAAKTLEIESPGPAGAIWDWLKGVKHWLAYWFLRAVNWFISLKVPLLTFSDTFFNLIQGKNQTTTRALAEVVVDQQKTLLRTAGAIRKNLNDLIDVRVKQKNPNAHDNLPHVRVNISVLSADQSSVFYISTAPGSAVLDFPKHSVAWVSVFTGMLRWWSSAFEGIAEQILLFDNSKGIIADAEPKMMLSSYYQDRSGDYGGFVIIPLPWPHRAFSKYVKGAIHISFRDANDIFAIWRHKDVASLPLLDPAASKKTYAYLTPERMLADWCSDDDVRAALQNSVFALSELLFGFNEIIYKNYIHPDPQS